VQFLAAQGARVTVTDLLPGAELVESLRQIEGLPLTLHLGEHQESDFLECDLLVVSPAVPKQNRFLQLAISARVPITSEIALFWQRNLSRTTVCITGSSGKSTTTSLVHAMLSESRRCWLGGNIGKSLLPVLSAIDADDTVILELSSFQLEDLEPLQPAPSVAIVTNFLPNHLDRHGTLAEYRNAKGNILRWQRADQLAVLNQDDPDVNQWITRGQVLWFGLSDEGREGFFQLPAGKGRSAEAVYRSAGTERVIELGQWLKLPGTHNLQNALAAACAALALGQADEPLLRGMSRFQGLPHRLELVAEVDGRQFINDSKSTTPTATVLALQTFDEPIDLLAGGYDKEIDLSSMVDEMLRRPVRAVALLGQTAATLDRMLAERDPEGRISRRVCETFAEAFAWSLAQSQPGDVVLLSPGCASYDWFRNYEERGEQFAQLCKHTDRPGQRS